MVAEVNLVYSQAVIKAYTYSVNVYSKIRIHFETPEPLNDFYMGYTKTSALKKATANRLNSSGPNTLRTRPAVPVLQKSKSEEGSPLPQKSSNASVTDPLMSGIEHLSGYSIEEIKTQYNSNKINQLQAMKPGQEQHLPNESWLIALSQKEQGAPTINPSNPFIKNKGVASAIIQRAKGDLQSGEIKIKPADGKLAIYVNGAIRPWFELSKKGYVQGDRVQFIEGDNRAVTDMKKTGHTDTEEEKAAAKEKTRNASKDVAALDAKTQIKEYDIELGIWELIPGRTNGDYQLRTTINGKEFCFHVHPPKYDNGDPIAGAVMEDKKQVENAATPGEIIKCILTKKGRPKGW